MLAKAPALAAAAALVAAGVVCAVPGTATATADCENGYVALTYDDGPTEKFTPALLSTLEENGVRATLFNIGQNAEKNPSQAAAQKSAGMWIGNHSWSHPHMPKLSEQEMRSQLQRTQQAIERLTGTTPELFRPPYGETDATVGEVAEELGLTEIIWDVDTRDWSGRSADQIVADVATARGGDVVLMHDGYPATVEAVPRIVADLHERGLCAGMISPGTGRAVEPDAGP